MNPYTIIAGLLLAVGLFGAGVHTGKKLERSGWQAKEIATKEATAVEHARLLAANETLRDKFTLDMKKASTDHENEIAANNVRLRADSNKRVPVSAAFCKSTAGKASEGTSAGSTQQADTGAGHLPDTFARDLRQLASDADQVTADLRQMITAAKAAGCFQN